MGIMFSKTYLRFLQCIVLPVVLQHKSFINYFMIYKEESTVGGRGGGGGGKGRAKKKEEGRGRGGRGGGS
jgi:hypothetical protein